MISRLDLGPVQLRPDGRRRFRVLQGMDAHVQQGLFRRCTAERLQKERAFASGFLRDHHGALLRKDVALVLSVGQTADIRAGDGFSISQVDADMVIVF